MIKKWKLSNSILSQGKVYLNKKDVVRLLEEDIRRRIEKRLDVKLANYPAELTLIGEKVKKLASEVIGEMETGASKGCCSSSFPTLY
jgi:DNA primase large subunit